MTLYGGISNITAERDKFQQLNAKKKQEYENNSLAVFSYALC